MENNLVTLYMLPAQHDVLFLYIWNYSSMQLLKTFADSLNVLPVWLKELLNIHILSYLSYTFMPFIEVEKCLQIYL